MPDNSPRYADGYVEPVQFDDLQEWCFSMRLCADNSSCIQRWWEESHITSCFAMRNYTKKYQRTDKWREYARNWEKSKRNRMKQQG